MKRLQFISCIFLSSIVFLTSCSIKKNDSVQIPEIISLEKENVQDSVLFFTGILHSLTSERNLYTLNLSNRNIDEIKLLKSNQTVIGCSLLDGENIGMIYTDIDPMTRNKICIYEVIDNNGTVVSQRDITKQLFSQPFIPGYIIMTQAFADLYGNWVIESQDTLSDQYTLFYVIRDDDNVLATSLETNIDTIFSHDSKLYCVIPNAENYSSGITFYQIDIENHAIHAVNTQESYVLHTYMVSIDKQHFLFSEGDMVSVYDVNANVCAQEFKWSTYNINYNNIICLDIMEDGRLAVLTYDVSTDSTFASETTITYIPLEYL